MLSLLMSINRKIFSAFAKLFRRFRLPVFAVWVHKAFLSARTDRVEVVQSFFRIMEKELFFMTLCGCLLWTALLMTSSTRFVFRKIVSQSSTTFLFSFKPVQNCWFKIIVRRSWAHRGCVLSLQNQYKRLQTCFWSKSLRNFCRPHLSMNHWWYLEARSAVTFMLKVCLQIVKNLPRQSILQEKAPRVWGKRPSKMKKLLPSKIKQSSVWKKPRIKRPHVRS